ncbi:MAG: hypothetical protein JNM75_00515 [Rhodospirillales bacterium]|nr:hypothetical protein [Rhodospirillales bacterium]
MAAKPALVRSARQICSRTVVTVMVGLASASTALAADVDWPTLTPGLWQFSRTLHAGSSEPTLIERQVCVDPVSEWKRQHAASERAGCKMTTRKVAADRFETVARCDLPNVGKGTSRSVAVIKSASAYEVSVENDGVLAKTGNREFLSAKRLGDCPK